MEKRVGLVGAVEFEKRNGGVEAVDRGEASKASGSNDKDGEAARCHGMAKHWMLHFQAAPP